MVKKFFYSILILVFIFAPIASNINANSFLSLAPNNLEDNFLVISKNTVWHKNDNLIFNKPIVIKNGATLIIESGSSIVFDQSENQMLMLGIKVLNGKIVANGETNEEITFSAKKHTHFNISIESKKYQSFFRYVVIDGGGNDSFFQAILPRFEKKSLFNKVYAQSAIYHNEANLSAMQINGGNVKIENSTFLNSVGGDVKVGVGIFTDKNGAPKDIYLPKVEIINSNFSDRQAVLANQCAEYSLLKNEKNNNCKELVYLKNNWYGDEKGPFVENGFNLFGNYSLDGFKKNKMITDPVILIPGILGSAFNTKGELKIDPVWHKYDDLIESFKRNGFEENKNFFTFPYNWRRSNRETAILLKYKIRQIKEKTKISKVDIVAHSMGGLVVREYVENGDYRNDIDQLIFLGTPHKGAPKTYLMWEAGEGYRKILRRHLNHEAKEKGYDDLGKYIREKIPSVQELLPNYSYLIDVKNNKQLKKYPDNYPRNKFLENLNAKEGLAKLKNLQIINFIGKTKSNKTISQIKIVDKKFADKWKDGYPDNFDDAKSDRGLILGSGDGTVPMASVNAIESDIQKEFDALHTVLPTKTQCEVVRELTGDFEDENLDEEDRVCKFIDEWDIPNMLLFQVFSPIDIQIIAPDGRRIGKDFETGGIFDEIPGAYYTGYKTNTEFITIPNPVDGEYKILAQGVGSGNYKIEVTDILQKDDDIASEKTLTFQGETAFNKKSQFEIKVKDAGILSTENFENGKSDDNENDNNEDDNVEKNVDENNNENDTQINNNEENLVITETIEKGNSNHSKHNKKKKHKKHQDNKLLAEVSNGETAKNSFVDNNIKRNNNDVENLLEKDNGVENEVMGDEVAENDTKSIEQDLNKDNKKSFLSLIGVALIGLLLLAGNLFGWLKIKKKKKDDF